MFTEQISLDQNSMIEVTTRIIAGEFKVILSIRGQKNQQEVTVTSAVLNVNDVNKLCISLNTALENE